MRYKTHGANKTRPMLPRPLRPMFEKHYKGTKHYPAVWEAPHPTISRAYANLSFQDGVWKLGFFVQYNTMVWGRSQLTMEEMLSAITTWLLTGEAE